MKTKELLKRFINMAPSTPEKSSDFNEGLLMVDKQFRNDFHSVVVARNISSESGLCVVIDEFQSKWNNLSNKIAAHFGVKILKRDCFVEVIIKEHSKELYNIYKSRKQ